MPALGGISAIVPKFAGDEVDKLERKVAVVDETGRLYPMLSLVADQWNAAPGQPRTARSRARASASKK